MVESVSDLAPWISPLVAGNLFLKIGHPGIASQNHSAQLLDILGKRIGWKRHTETYHRLL